MKAVLAESKDKKKLRSVIIFLTSGKVGVKPGDPASIAVELERDNIRVWEILPWEVDLFQVIKEIEVDGSLLLKVLDYRNAAVEHGYRQVELKNRLIDEMITPHCDTWTFLGNREKHEG